MRCMDDPALTECGGDMSPPYGLEYGGVVQWSHALRCRFESCRRAWVSFLMGHGGCASALPSESAPVKIRQIENDMDARWTKHGEHSRVMQVRFLPRPP